MYTEKDETGHIGTNVSYILHPIEATIFHHHPIIQLLLRLLPIGTPRCCIYQHGRFLVWTECEDVMRVATYVLLVLLRNQVNL
jgi:hypothetical protein